MGYKTNSKLLVQFVVFLLYVSISRGADNEWCQDVYDLKTCDRWNLKGYCTSRIPRLQKMMRQMCKETCNYCEPPSPEVCYNGNHEKSKYGCCWDGITAATGPDGQGCPACENKKTRRFCSMMRDLCFTRNNHKLLRLNCPETCGYCKKAPHPCDDDSGNCQSECYDVLPQELCERRKWAGYCSLEGWKDYLQKNCARTCRYCGANQCRDITLTRVCYVWRGRNRCEKAGATWKRFMTDNCKLTCGFCSVDRRR
ncbi:uncharacterized protein LOC144645565 isoform X1 [Oculina patagonica]